MFPGIFNMTHTERIALEYIYKELISMKPLKEWLESKPEFWENRSKILGELFTVMRSSRPEIVNGEVV